MEKEHEFIRKVENFAKEEKDFPKDLGGHNINIPLTLKKLLVEFGSYVTIDGLAKIIESQTRLRRSIWIIVVIVMSVWGTYQCVTVSLDYFSYPKTVTVNVAEETRVEFPAITICNLNPLPNKDKLRNHEVWGAFIGVEDTYSEAKECDNLQKGISNDYNDYDGGSGDNITESGTGGTDAPPTNAADGNAVDGNTTDVNAADGNTTDVNAADGNTTDINAADDNVINDQGLPGNASLIEGTYMVYLNTTEHDTIGNTTSQESQDHNDTIANDSQNISRRKRETSKDPVADYLDILDGKRDGLLNITYYQKLLHYMVSLASGASDLKTETTKTYSLEDIIKIREECSNYYKYLSYVKNESNFQEQPTITFAATKEKGCRLMSNFNENVTFNTLCNMEVFCDNFGCYDYNLQVYGEKRKSNDSDILVCPSCANYDQMWPTVSYNENVKYCGMNSTESKKCPSSTKWDNCLSGDWMTDWTDGNITDKQVIGSFKTSKTNDLSDVMGLYTPSIDDLKKYSVRKEDFIRSCSYDQRRCSDKGFFEWRSDKFGMCYTFNSVFTNNTLVPGKIKKTTSYGPKNGLRLTLDIKADQYISLLSPDIGARVIVHSPRQMPFPIEEGFNVAPGMSISVGITRKEFIRVGSPYGQCRSDSGSKLLKEYSATRCRKMCVEKEYWRLCGCYEGLNPAYNGTNDELRPLQHCSAFNITQKMCMEKVMFLYQQGGLNCGCYPSCNEMKYLTQVTPNDENLVFYKLVQNLKKINTDVCSKNSDLSIVRLQFYLTSLNHETIQESPTYTFDMFIANIGNNLGLFIGMSLMTFIELLEFMVDLSMFCGISACKGKQSNRVTKVTSAKDQRFDAST